ncbi:Guanylate kinase [Candidatus Fokinia solitaria]|uniref:Guanylate kinase n=1 Tax=Candidatus Fokinia solitaria TaxID=1802984 RepID=A0A2U8BRY6_9RICK|nr:guanylate kinase [Candidatus Fokinia solitaria]AWD33102.1 Guanylate kinase [Candidatus Fokinia solitaria]
MKEQNKKTGVVMVVSGPSGTGKTTISTMLAKLVDNLRFSISFTTRNKRVNEIDGESYHFVTREYMEQLRDKGELLECAEVFGNLYGTSKVQIEEQIMNGRDIISDVDVQGYIALKSLLPNNVFGVFLLPPSKEEVLDRLSKRGGTATEIATRFKAFQEEISHHDQYDYVIFNYDMETTLHTVKNILSVEKCKRSRNLNVIHDYINAMSK